MKYNDNPWVHADISKWINWKFNEEWAMHMVLKYLPTKYYLQSSK